MQCDETSQTSRTDLQGEWLLLLARSEAAGTRLHSQVPEQNRRNLSGLNRTQNRRSQKSVSVCSGVWNPLQPLVYFLTFISPREARTYLNRLIS